MIVAIYNKSINLQISDELKSEYFIANDKREELINKYKNDESEKNINLIINIHNFIFVLTIVLVLVLLIGSYKYYERQSIEHADNWSWMTFWFGSHNKCQ